jgi:steroid delta-isomerase-like uncharacterized protein
MPREENITAQTKFGDAVNAGTLNDLDALVSPSVVDNDPAEGQAAGAQGYKDFFGELRTAFPDFQIEVRHLVADDDNVAFAYTASGTNSGPFKGNEPTGKKVSFSGMQISRFENGLLVERWGSSDELGLMAQLGLA